METQKGCLSATVNHAQMRTPVQLACMSRHLGWPTEHNTLFDNIVFSDALKHLKLSVASCDSIAAEIICFLILLCVCVFI